MTASSKTDTTMAHTAEVARIIADAVWRANNARNLAARSRDNLFAAIDGVPDHGNFTWAERAILDQRASERESAKARADMEAARAAIAKAEA
ncbi:hypothetical protein [Mesorhizobium sp. BE184]|uniref:hypothetical protein n=1 Tax=Mesorhizobium sp. BE184 TaxID=2817714 RepID=UPI002866779F|nr:hypothetical protein [Mesorhizobium sp. BE184]MDR7032400.1 hypothetical protein [Mesorhizobium sp. BE184]